MLLAGFADHFSHFGFFDDFHVHPLGSRSNLSLNRTHGRAGFWFLICPEPMLQLLGSLGAIPRLFDLMPKESLEVFKFPVPFKDSPHIVIHAPVTSASVALDSPHFGAKPLNNTIFVTLHPTQGALNQSLKRTLPLLLFFLHVSSVSGNAA